MVEFVFTITQGRTGTRSVAEFFKRHDPTSVAVHELLEVNAHGILTPDVGQMRRFNTHGLTQEIEAFWKRKLTIIRDEMIKRDKQRYVETSHMNAKSGLVEYVLKAASDRNENKFRFIVLD